MRDFYNKEAPLDSNAHASLRVRVFDAARAGEEAGVASSLIFSVGVPGAEYVSAHLTEAGLEALIGVAQAALVQRRIRREAYEGAAA